MELSREEAAHALVWAASLEGWEDSELKPVILCTAGPGLDTHSVEERH